MHPREVIAVCRYGICYHYEVYLGRSEVLNICELLQKKNRSKKSESREKPYTGRTVIVGAKHQSSEQKQKRNV